MRAPVRGAGQSWRERRDVRRRGVRAGTRSIGNASESASFSDCTGLNRTEIAPADPDKYAPGNGSAAAAAVPRSATGGGGRRRGERAEGHRLAEITEDKEEGTLAAANESFYGCLPDARSLASPLGCMSEIRSIKNRLKGLFENLMTVVVAAGTGNLGERARR
jgi:hypothetical protein